MKKLMVFAVALSAVFLMTAVVKPVGASADPIASIEWADPAMGGWAFGDATRSVAITLDDASSYDTMTTSDIGWYWSPAGEHTDADSVTQDGNTYTATFNLTGTTQQAGVLNITVRDGITHEPIVLTEQGATDMSMFMAHNINISGSGPNGLSNSDPSSPCYYAGRTDETTDLTAVTDFRAVSLTVMCPARGKIHFTSTLDFTSSAGMQALRSIFESLDSDMGGELGLSDSTIAMLRDAGAELTMYGLPYSSTPDIKYNGGDASSTASGIVYDTTAKTLTLNAAHFSTYTAVPKVTLSDPTGSVTVSSAKYTIKGTVSDPGATVTIKVGSTDQGAVTVNSTTGAFEKEVTLASSANTVTVSSSNTIGSGFDVTRTITYTALAATGMPKWFIGAIATIVLVGLILIVSRRKVAA